MKTEIISEGYNTKKRRAVIRRLVAEEAIGTQNDLTKRLKEEGFETTQSTVSRDIRELQLIKRSGKHGKFYALPDSAPENVSNLQISQMYHSCNARAERAMNLVVIHTDAGMCQALCAVLDRLSWNGILGTLAGEDTILMIARDEQAAMETMEVLAGF